MLAAKGWGDIGVPVEPLTEDFLDVAREGELTFAPSLIWAAGDEPIRISDPTGNWANAIIDEVRISSVARYSDNFTPARRFEPDDQTIGLWHFDEGNGEVAYDYGWWGRQGTLHEAPWTTESVCDVP
jgi:hypothetical protein